MLTAEENIVLPLSLAGREAGPRSGSTSCSTTSASTTGARTARPSSPAASSSASRSPGRSSRGRPSLFADEPTGNLDSRDRRRDPRAAPRVGRRARARRPSWSPTTRARRRSPTASLFLADGVIVRELGRSSQHEILAALKEVRRDDARRAQRTRGRKLRGVLTALAIVLGVAMVSGSLRPHRHDRRRRSTRSSRPASYDRTDARRHRQGRRLPRRRQLPKTPVDSQALAAEVSPRCRQVDADVGGDPRPGEARERQTASRSRSQPDLRVRHRRRRRRRRFNPLDARRGALGARARRGRDRRRHGAGASTSTSATRSASSPTARCARSGSSGIASYGGVDSLGGATVAVFDLRDGAGAARQAGPGRRRSRSRRSRASRRATLRRSGRPVRCRRPPRGADRREAQTAFDVEGVKSSSRSSGGSCSRSAGIALFVGAFIIFNTLSITVAQRTREFALLRTLGASRRQVLRSVVLEAFVIGARGLGRRARARRAAREGPERRS